MEEANAQQNISDPAQERSNARELTRRQQAERKQKRAQNIQRTGQATEAGGKAVKAGGQILGFGGRALSLAGGVLSRTGLGAIVGAPMMVAGKAGEAAGKGTQVAGKAMEKTGKTLQQTGKALGKINMLKEITGSLNPVGSDMRLKVAFKALWTLIGFLPSLAYLDFHFFMNIVGNNEVFGDFSLGQKFGLIVVNLLFMLVIMGLIALISIIVQL